MTLHGHVARLVNSDELVINLGSADGVVVGMHFGVIEPATQDVPDPITNENLGTLPIYRAEVTVTTVGERLCLARKSAGSGVASALALLNPPPRTPLNPEERWREGVDAGDQVVQLSMPKRHD